MPYFKAFLTGMGSASTGQKAVRIIRSLALLAAVLNLAACAGTGAGLQKDGRYVLESHEKSLDCQGLYKSIWGRVQLMQGLPSKARSEQQNVAPTLSLALGRMFGGGGASGSTAYAEYERERAHVEALHAAMIEKKCITIDLEREIGPIATEMAAYRK